MFEKLLSLLPYNPGLTHQLAFYSQRMREEATIRRSGLVFLVLAFMVQFFAVLSPPQSTSAASNNDLLNGGFSTAAEAASACNNNTQNYGDILNNYGISCREVANAPMVTIHSTDDNRQLYSMGRLPYNLAGETPVSIGGHTYYVRYLWAWDKSGTVSTYSALRIIASTGTTYYLLAGCGNLTSIGLPQPYVPTTPQLSLTKTTIAGYPAANSTVAPGATLGYHVNINNTGNGTAHSVTLIDTIPDNTTFVSQSLNAGATEHTFDTSTRTAHWTWATIAPETGAYSVDLTVTVNAATANGTRICNMARVDSPDTPASNSNQVCMTVQRGAPPPSTVPTTTPMPAPPSTPTPTPTPPASCAQNLSSQNTIACVQVHKTAANLTTGLSDANGSTAHAGDSILYTLYAQNTGKATVNDFTFQENLSDVMDYATPVDLHGGALDGNDVVSWPAVTIASGQTLTRQITVKVKDPIPNTPADPADPGHFDHVMTNVYGNTITINVPSNATTAIETAATSLPNTGPGTSLFMAGLIVVVAGYFYSRARLLSRESVIALQETTAA